MVRTLTAMVKSAASGRGFRACMVAAVLILACQAAWAEAPFVYVNNNVSSDPSGNSVTAYRVDLSSGALSMVTGSPFLTEGDGLPDGAIDGLVCCGSFLYAINDDSETVAGFSVNSSSGALQAVPDSPFAVIIELGDSPHGMACTPDGRILFVSMIANAPQEHIRIFDIDPATGSLTPNSNDPFLVPANWAHPVDLEMNADGTLLFVSQVLTDEMHGSVGVYRVAANGALSALQDASFPIAGLGGGAVLAPGGKRYYVANNETSISGFSVDVDGTLTPLSGSPFPYQAIDVATDDKGTFLFATDPTHGGNGRIHVLRIDPATGALSAVEGSPFDNDSRGSPGWTCIDRSVCLRGEWLLRYLRYHNQRLLGGSKQRASVLGTGITLQPWRSGRRRNGSGHRTVPAWGNATAGVRRRLQRKRHRHRGRTGPRREHSTGHTRARSVSQLRWKRQRRSRDQRTGPRRQPRAHGLPEGNLELPLSVIRQGDLSFRLRRGHHDLCDRGDDRRVGHDVEAGRTVTGQRPLERRDELVGILNQLAVTAEPACREVVAGRGECGADGCRCRPSVSAPRRHEAPAAQWVIVRDEAAGG